MLNCVRFSIFVFVFVYVLFCFKNLFFYFRSVFFSVLFFSVVFFFLFCLSVCLSVRLFLGGQEQMKTNFSLTNAIDSQRETSRPFKVHHRRHRRQSGRVFNMEIDRTQHETYREISSLLHSLTDTHSRTHTHTDTLSHTRTPTHSLTHLFTDSPAP